MSKLEFCYTSKLRICLIIKNKKIEIGVFDFYIYLFLYDDVILYLRIDYLHPEAKNCYGRQFWHLPRASLFALYFRVDFIMYRYLFHSTNIKPHSIKIAQGYVNRNSGSAQTRRSWICSTWFEPRSKIIVSRKFWPPFDMPIDADKQIGILGCTRGIE